MTSARAQAASPAALSSTADPPEERSGAGVVALGDVGGGPGEHAGDRRRASPAARRSSSDQMRRGSSIAGPSLEGLVGCPQAFAADAALEPVDRARSRPSRTPQEQDVVAAVPSPATMVSSSRLAPGCRRGQRDARLGRQRDAHPSERAGDQRRLAVGAADHDRDLVGIGAVGEQSRDLATDQLRLAAEGRPPRAAATRPGSIRSESGSKRLRSRWWSTVPALGTAGARSVTVAPNSSREDTEQLGPRGQGLAVLEGRGDDDLGRGGERADQLDLFAGQVVEAVEEDRTALPGVGRRAQDDFVAAAARWWPSTAPPASRSRS